MAERLSKAPEHTHAKIISGKLNVSYFQENLLPNMPYILSNEGLSVEDYWRETEKELGSKINIVRSMVWECK